MVRVPSISVAVGLLIAILGFGCGDPPGTKITDDDLKIWRNTLSPDGSPGSLSTSTIQEPWVTGEFFGR